MAVLRWLPRGDQRIFLPGGLQPSFYNAGFNSCCYAIQIAVGMQGRHHYSVERDACRVGIGKR